MIKDMRKKDLRERRGQPYRVRTRSSKSSTMLKDMQEKNLMERRGHSSAWYDVVNLSIEGRSQEADLRA